jgi:hypothetical protein
MSYEITIEPKQNYLHATVTGENSKESVIGYVSDVRRECEKRDCFRVLIEECLEGPRLHATDLFTIISEGSARAPGFYDAVAYVDVHAGELLGFIETVAINKGMPFAAFSSVEDAEEWLRNHDGDGVGQNFITRTDQP